MNIHFESFLFKFQFIENYLISIEVKINLTTFKEPQDENNSDVFEIWIKNEISILYILNQE